VYFTGWRKPISNPGVGKVAWRYTALAAFFFRMAHWSRCKPDGPYGKDTGRLSQAIPPLPHTAATITTRILSRALQPVIVMRSDKAQLLAAAVNTLQLAIDYPVFSIDGGIITCRAILRPRRADRRG